MTHSDEINANANTPRQRKSKSKPIKTLKVLEQDTEENQSRLVYPVDFWFLVSRYIRPEQVKTFSLICRDACHVTLTIGFWLRIYNNFISTFRNLPARLQPHSIDSKPGIQARVIRALFYSYSPFASHVLRTTPLTDNLDQLEYQTCVLFWWKQVLSVKRGSEIWVYYFKFTPDKNKLMGRHNGQDEKDFFLTSNSERDNCIIQVTSPNFMNIKSVMGLILTTINVCVGRDMRYHQLKMTFHNKKRGNNYHKSDGTLIALDPIFDAQLLHWWNPLYPHPLDK